MADAIPKLVQYVVNEDISGATSVLTSPEGADPNWQLQYDRDIGEHKFVRGDSVLHIAVKMRNATLVKLLIIFDAKLQVKNRMRETPLTVANNVHAAECGHAISQVLELRKKLPLVPKKSAKPVPKQKDDDVFLLSLDGGGIRGLVFIQSIIELDKRREQLYRGSKPFLDYFNWITGNSTGGIAALALAIGKDPTHGRRLYFHLKNKVLMGKPPFDNDRITEVLQNTFGSATTMSSIEDQKKYNVSVMTTLACTNPPKLHIMRSYGGPPDDGQASPSERRIWEAARATSAAVPYFHPFGNFIDGGFIANNPTIDGIVDMLRHTQEQRQTVKIKVVISFGCGYVTPEAFEIDKKGAEVDPHQEYLTMFTNFSVSLGAPLEKFRDWWHKVVEKGKEVVEKGEELAEELRFGAANWRTILNVMELCVAQSTQPSGEVVQRAKVFSEAMQAKYQRVNPKIGKVNFVEKDDEKLINMLYTTMVYMLENHELMDEVLKSVMEN